MRPAFWNIGKTEPNRQAFSSKHTSITLTRPSPRFAPRWIRRRISSLGTCFVGYLGSDVYERRAAAHPTKIKTDQDGAGRKIAIPFGLSAQTCGVLAMKAWLAVAGIESGPVFRSIRKGSLIGGTLSDKAVALILKRYVAASRLDLASFSGHSLRAGLVTSAARAGVAERVIMRQTGHKSINMVLRYVRQANAFTENAVNALGL